MTTQLPTRPPALTADPAGDEPDGRSGVVLVTGAAGGIGRATVEALHAADHRVVAADVDEAILADLVGEPAVVATVALDVRDPVAVEAGVALVETEHGPIVGLVCAHGVLRPGAALAQDDLDWAEVFDINASGVMRVCRAVTRRMAARQRGAVVVIGSNAAAVARDGISAYASSKAAARHYALCLGLELAPLGVRVNVVSPGSTDTPMLSSAWTAAAPEPGSAPAAVAKTAAAGSDRELHPHPALEGAASRRAIAGNPEAFWPGIPLGRIAAPAQIASTVAFLLSPAADHIALHDLRVDGGATLGA